MNDHEGSVFTEDSDVDESQEESTTEDANTTEGTEGETSDKGEESKEESTESTLTSQEQKDKEELTEKGTKLAADPLSRVNQELANERAKIRQYEQVLNDPSLLKSYVAQFDKTDTKAEAKDEEPEIKYADVETTEDLQKFLKQQDSKVQAKLKELDTTISSVKSTQKDTVVANRIQSDIATVREDYQELNPKSNAYNQELDMAVGQLYEKFDLDPQTKSFKGQVSIKEIADIVMKAHSSSKKQGTTEAQTTIRDKRTGKAVSGASSTAPDESGMSASQLIASRIRAAANRR
jgi:hypothetical protein